MILKKVEGFDLLFEMTKNELRTRYKSTVLGFLWVIISSFSQMLVMGFVFHFFMPGKIENYFIFLFVGLLPWNFFSSSVLRGTPIYVYKRRLIKKAYFKRGLIALSIVFANLVHYLMATFFLVLVLAVKNILIEGGVGASFLGGVVHVVVFVLLLIWLLLFTVGVVLLLSAINTKYRDVNFLVKAAMPLYFYVTPVLYSLDMVPENYRRFLYFNPMVGIVSSFRWVLMGIGGSNGVGLLKGVLVSSLVLVSGVKTFKVFSVKFDDWL